MKRFFIIFGVLFILLLQFTSCLNDENDKGQVYYFYDEPAVIYQLGKYPMVRNQSDLFYVPELADNTTLEGNELLWTSFIVDLNDQEQLDYLSVKHYTARHFKYKTVDSAKVIIPSDVAEFKSYLLDDYSDSIKFSVLYKYAIENLWFFGFKQKDNSTYVYELVMNPEIEDNQNNYPTLYIRAKKTDPSPRSDDKAYSNDGNIFAFDAADFADYYSKTISATDKTVKFNLKYKIGVDANGKDIYREFMSNPISWKF